jgi:hypothetical protein
VTGDATVATAALLLVSVTLVATVGVAANVTVPWVVPPTPMLDAASSTLETAVPVEVGDAGELEPQPVAADRTVSAARKYEVGRRVLIQG